MGRCTRRAVLMAVMTGVVMLTKPVWAQEATTGDGEGDEGIGQYFDLQLEPVALSEVPPGELAISAVVLVLGWGVAWMVFRLLKRLSMRSPGKENAHRIDNILLRAFAMPAAIAVALLTVHYSLFRIDQIRDAFARWDGLREATIVLTGSWILASLVKNFLNFYVLPFAQRDDTDIDERLIRILDLVIVYVIWSAGVLIALRSVGIEITAFLASMGILGLAVALAAQTVLSNVLAGITLTADPSIEIGNRVEVLGYFGDIERINIHKTVVRTRDNLLVSIPNDVLAKEVVVNWDQPRALTRMKLTVGVGYGSDVEQVTEVIDGVLDRLSGDHEIGEEQAPEVIFDGFGNNALEFTIYVWLDGPRGRRHVRDHFNRKLLTRFREEDIEIPFPQRVVHMAAKDD